MLLQLKILTFYSTFFVVFKTLQFSLKKYTIYKKYLSQNIIAILDMIVLPQNT